MRVEGLGCRVYPMYPPPTTRTFAVSPPPCGGGVRVSERGEGSGASGVVGCCRLDAGAMSSGVEWCELVLSVVARCSSVVEWYQVL